MALACLASAAALTVQGAGPAGATPGSPGRAAGAGQGPGQADVVTLLTGDRVLLGADGRVNGYLPAEGREEVPARVYTAGEETLVVPLDVLPLLGEGTLDRRLFEISELARTENRQAGGLPLIVTYTEGQQPRLLAEETGSDSTALDSINGEALTVTQEEATEVWNALTDPADGTHPLSAAPGVENISLDGLVEKTLDESVPQIGAPEVWDAGYDGEGVKIAILDTGISSTHPDVAGQVVAAENFSQAEDAEDRDGHGTHVASTAAGTGALSDGRYRGVAPGADLLNGKVLDDDGFGFESDIIAGMEWAVEQQADIISMSLGGPPGTTADPLEEAVDRLSAASDSLFVVAAGNAGPTAASIGTPGTADAALTLGAVDKSDGLAPFSSIGPRLRDGGVKPDVTAPGVDIAAAGAEGAAIWDYGTPVEDGYVAVSGTSMATPHAAGTAALVAQAHPDWTGEEIKAAVIAAALPHEAYSPYQQGAGRIRAPEAVAQTVLADGPLGFGSVPYPHEDDQPVVEDLTYRNHGTEDVTLDLTATGTGPDGTEAPEGFFTLSTDRVSVPAGGTATIQVAADTSLGGENHGSYGVYVTATPAEGGQAVTTAGGVVREEQRFDLTVNATGRDGSPGTGWSVSLFNLATAEFLALPAGEDGTAAARLPEGEYLVDVSIPVLSADGEEIIGYDWLVQPSVRLTEDTTVTANAADAQPVTFTGPDADAALADLTVGFSLTSPDAGVSLGTAWLSSGFPEGFHTAALGPVAEGWQADAYAAATLTGPDREVYLADRLEGAFYTGADVRVGEDELATLTTRQGVSLPDRTGYLFTSSTWVPWQIGHPTSLPATREAWVQATAGQWQQTFWQDESSAQVTEVSYVSDPRTLEPGESYEDTFNVGVFGPKIGPDEGIFRSGDELWAIVNLFGDGAGHSGGSVHDSATTTLYLGDEVLAEDEVSLDEAFFLLPPEEGDYRLVTTARRDGVGAAVSTEVSATYTFTSAAVAEDEIVHLPASAIRFTPELALDSTAPAGRPYRVPVLVQGSAAQDGGADTLAVSVSYDSGRTWEEVPVTDGAVQVDNPAAGGTVSFRAEVADAQGNTLSETIIDAYRTA